MNMRRNFFFGNQFSVILGLFLVRPRLNPKLLLLLTLSRSMVLEPMSRAVHCMSMFAFSIVMITPQQSVCVVIVIIEVQIDTRFDSYMVYISYVTNTLCFLTFTWFLQHFWPSQSTSTASSTSFALYINKHKLCSC